MKLKKSLIVVFFFLATAALVYSMSATDYVEMALRFAVALIIVFCLARGAKEPVLLNPYFLFAITPLSLLPYNSNLSSYFLLPLQPTTWLVAIAGMASFLVALEVVRSKESAYKGKKAWLGLDIPRSKLVLFGIFLSVLGFLPACFESFPFSSSVGLLLTIGVVVSVKSGNKFLIVFSIVLMGIQFILAPNKSQALSLGFLCMLCFEIYRGARFGDKRIPALIVGVFVLVFVFVMFPLKYYVFGSENASLLSFFTAGDTGSLALSNYESRVSWQGPSSLFLPYMYLVTPWCNLQYVLDTQSFTSYGLWLIKPFVSYLQLDTTLSGYYNLVPYASAWNTFSFLGCCVADFGVVGAVIEPFFLGVFVKYIYTSAIGTRGPLAVAAYVTVARAVFEMFFSNHFFSLSYPFTMAILCLAISLVFSRWYGLSCFGEVQATEKPNDYAPPSYKLDYAGAGFERGYAYDSFERGGVDSGPEEDYADVAFEEGDTDAGLEEDCDQRFGGVDGTLLEKGDE